MEKVVIRLRGGLGNQMFQYAFALLLEEKYNPSIIELDTREYKDYYWPLGLSDFVLNNKVAFTDKKQKYDFKIKWFRFLLGIRKKTIGYPLGYLNERLLNKGYLLSGRFCNSVPNCLDNQNRVYAYGYFQNATLLEPIRERLTHEFSLKKITNLVNQFLEKIEKNRSLCLSIRIAKQAELDSGERYIYSGKDYYLNLIKIIEKKRGYKPQLIVASNDIQRIKDEKWFDDYVDVIYIEGCSATEQIEILKNCKDYILSNSTFSWWIAYLGSFKKDSVILIPRTWYQGDDVEKNSKLLFDGVEIIDD